MLAAVILAAGESRRMGSPKALVPFHGRPFLEHLLEVTRHPKVGVQRVVLGAGAEDICNKLQLDPASVVVNPRWEEGQLTSIHTAVNSLPPGTDGMMLCLVDHPLITAALVGELISKFYSSQRLVVVPTYLGKRGHPVIFSSKLYPELLAAPTDKGARAVVWAHAVDLLEVPTAEEGVILNLNDPDTMRKAMDRTTDVS
jgi:molybdenum cofactor cytidylyltransferase